jgi:hypothetical protein
MTALAANKIRAAHTAFSRETFARLLNNFASMPGFHEGLQRVHENPGDLARIKDRVESVRARSDSWIIDTFRLPLFEMAQFYGQAAAPRTRAGRERRANLPEHLRPAVAILLRLTDGALGAETLLGSLLERTTYRNADVFVCSDCGSAAARALLGDGSLVGNPRVHLLTSSAFARLNLAENLGSALAGAEYVAVLDDRVVILDENWVEKFLLLFERHPRLALACPRTRRIEPGRDEEYFDVLWDWSEPGFFRIRRGLPLSASPYQAFSCPETLLFFKRSAFVELGGFDGTYGTATGRIKDFAIRAWLSGHEVYCHPGIVVGRRAAPAGGAAAGPSPVPELDQLLPAAKYFSNQKRFDCCRRHSLGADRLARRHLAHAARLRGHFLRRAKFDDDWLFFKFSIEDPPTSSVGTERREALEESGGTCPSSETSETRRCV